MSPAEGYTGMKLTQQVLTSAISGTKPMKKSVSEKQEREEVACGLVWRHKTL
jgi:hypothetical protein